MSEKHLNITDVQVVTILDISFNISELLYREGVARTRFTIKHDTGFNPDTNLFNLTLLCYYRYDDSDDILSSIAVQNIFYVPNLKNYIHAETKAIALPGETLITCLGMSVSHTRALFAKNLRGTLFQDLIIPPINPVALANEMFFQRKEEALIT